MKREYLFLIGGMLGCFLLLGIGYAGYFGYVEYVEYKQWKENNRAQNDSIDNSYLNISSYAEKSQKLAEDSAKVADGLAKIEAEKMANREAEILRKKQEKDREEKDREDLERTLQQESMRVANMNVDIEQIKVDLVGMGKNYDRGREWSFDALSEFSNARIINTHSNNEYREYDVEFNLTDIEKGRTYYMSGTAKYSCGFVGCQFLGFTSWKYYRVRL